MGRWAQYRTRGRGAATTAFPLPAPAFESEWIGTQTDPGDLVDITLEVLIACPSPADGMLTEYGTSDTGPWTSGENASCGDVTEIASGIAAGSYWVRVAWQTDGVTQISPWSDPRPMF